jgi:hypothetical protein
MERSSINRYHHFEVKIPVTPDLDSMLDEVQYTEEEARNIKSSIEYIQTVNSNESKGRGSIKHLVNTKNYFIAPATTPEIKDAYDHAESCKQINQSMPDFKILSFDNIVSKGGLVFVHVTGSGTFSGRPYQEIEPTFKRGNYRAGFIFQFNPEGKIVSIIREFDKTSFLMETGIIDKEVYEKEISIRSPKPMQARIPLGQVNR